MPKEAPKFSIYPWKLIDKDFINLIILWGSFYFAYDSYLQSMLSCFLLVIKDTFLFTLLFISSHTMSQDDLPHYMPVISLYKEVIYPKQVKTLILNHPAHRSALFSIDIPEGLILLTFYPSKTAMESYEDVVPVAIVAKVLSHLTLDRERDEITLLGIKRVCLNQVVAHGDILEGWSSSFDQATFSDIKIEIPAHEHFVYVNKMMGLYSQLAQSFENRFPSHKQSLLNHYQDEPDLFLDLLVQNIKVDLTQKYQWLSENSLLARLDLIYQWMQDEQMRSTLAKEIEVRTKLRFDGSRRDFYLRQQLKTIQQELGDSEEPQVEADLYQEKLEALDLHESSHTEIAREIKRLRQIQPTMNEFQVIKTYLDRIFELPWQDSTEESIDLTHVRFALDEQHFALKKVKERILEFLAVRRLNPHHRGPILCLAGPPGVGKTSLGKSIAKAIGRTFFKMSVGGMKDEAEIRGHRRTYIAAMPGKILTGLSRVHSKNPLFMIDEIDKIASDHRGDPASALLELLDPEQNHAFIDHYFNIPFDLSEVMWIVTANYLHDIPKPLLDRLEIIRIEGYTEQEKINIAQSHLIPDLITEHGLQSLQPQFPLDALQSLIRHWTREAGVREMKRTLQQVCRKMALDYLEKAEQSKQLALSVDRMSHYLGVERYQQNEGISHDSVGVAHGLAWTASGGEVLIIEALKMKGKGNLVITGKLGEVMKESVQTAHSLIRARIDVLGIDFEDFDTHDIHVHFPAGAVPKDGPSAGITVTLALGSLLSGRKVNATFAMTGEVTLRGKVLAVGGIKDKILAAYRIGLMKIIVPEANRKDLIDLPNEVKDTMSFHCVHTMDEVFTLALLALDHS